MKKSISKTDLFNTLVANNDIYEIYNLLSLFNVYMKDNKFVKAYEDKVGVYIHEDLVVIEGSSTTEPIFIPSDVITLKAENVKCLSKDVKTTVGVALLNLILIEKGLNGKAAYINENFSIKTVENREIVPRLLLTDNPLDIEDMYSFDTAVRFLEGLNATLVQPTSLKALLPPPDIAKKKAKIIKEMVEKYGKDCFEDPIYTTELEEQLFAIDREWMKGDPTLDIGSDGKIMNTTRKKLFLMIGQDTAMPGTTPGTVFRSLTDGYGLDPEDVTAIFNGIIAGNYSKGKETQVGGTYAKLLIRVSSGMKVGVDDCGSTEGFITDINKDNAKGFYGRYYMNKAKEPFVFSKEVYDKHGDGYYNFRTKAKCFSPGSEFCKTCSGDIHAEYEFGSGHNLLQLAGDILNASMKAMHANVMSLQYFPLHDNIH